MPFDNLNDLKNKLEGAVIALIEDFNKMKAGRPNPKILDKIDFLYYGAPTKFSSAATIRIEARTLVIQPHDSGALNEMQKSIQKSNIGINPNNDGKCLRLVFPMLTEESRKKLLIEVKERKEKSKISIRNIRRETFEKIKNDKKNSKITEDEVKSSENKVQKLIDEYIAEIEKISSAKEKEIMTV